MHKLLQRQLKKCGLAGQEMSPEWQVLLERVSQAYADADQDRYTIERSLELSSREMRALNEALQAASETRLAAERNKLQLIVDSISDGLCLLDAKAGLVMMNPAAEALLGCRFPELEGRDFFATVLDPGDADSALQVDLLKRDIAAGTAYAEANRQFLCQDKSGFPVEFRINPFFADEEVAGAVLVFRDITERKQAESELRAEREKALVTLGSIADAVITTNADGKVEFANPVACFMLGMEEKSVLGSLLSEVMQLESGMDGQILEIHGGSMAAIVEGSPNPDFWLFRKDGLQVSVDISAAPIHDGNDVLIGEVIVLHDVTETRRLNEQLEYQATHDALTGLVNRREFEARLDSLAQTAEPSRRSHSMLYLDLDQFKIVNDTCGHCAGDELLRQLSDIFRRRLRKSDVFGRLGGDEFGVLLEDCSLDDAIRIGNQLLESVDRFRFEWDNRLFDVGVSIGIAMIGEGRTDPKEIMAAADVAVYAAKEGGRNRVHVYQHSDEALMERRGEMEWYTRITDALIENRFELFCQPIVAVEDPQRDDFQRYELLIRLNEESGDVVPPGAFLPAAERYGLSMHIDRWVFGTALQSLKELARERRREKPMSWSINIAGTTLTEPGFIEFLKKRGNCESLLPHRICIEITETAAVTNISEAARAIEQLTALGYFVALDDFGSGMCSFSYLKNLPVHFLKIDGAFVRDISSDPVDLALVESINQVGQVMGKQTVAEFVEDATTLELLREIGVDFAQGFAISRPFPLTELIQPSAYSRAVDQK